MFNLLQTASDDQTSIGLCVLVLSASALFVFASFHMGPAGRRMKELQRKNNRWSTKSAGTTHTISAHERAA